MNRALMKINRKLLLVFPVILVFMATTVVFLPQNAVAQNIVGAEYFFDTDPGFGNGTSVSLTPAPNITNLNFTVDISSLSPGFHCLFVRVMDDSSRWSITQKQPFYRLIPDTVPANMVRMEYFFDSDPGFGGGTIIPFTGSMANDNLNITIDISGLSEGFHCLFVRAEDDNGKWSLTDKRVFYRLISGPLPPDIDYAEYFFDTDPGFGNGTSVPLTPSITIDPLDFNIDITSLTEGFHFLFVRVRNSVGVWSQVTYRSFYKTTLPATEPDITEIEYFFNTDPGYSNGTSLAFSPSPNVDSLDYTIDITSLTEGFHSLFIRSKDGLGRWSQTCFKVFFKTSLPAYEPNIVEIEHFFDADPGFGNGTKLSITPGPVQDLLFNVDISGLSEGFHNLFIRAKDSTGQWSQTTIIVFYKQVIPDIMPDIVYAEYYFDTDPGFSNAIPVPLPADTTNLSMVFTINIDSLSKGFHSIYFRVRDALGKWSMTRIMPFYKQIIFDPLPLVEKVEYFFDTDPGFGNGINVPVTPGENIPFLAWQLNVDSISFGEHQLFVRVKDNNDKWSQVTHDTIFYYLDTLPTASLSGPVGVCIYDTATFEVTLTGTAPWTLEYDDGFNIQTVGNIMTSPYFFEVNPQLAGHRIAKVLHVSDVYYTGLYTGIPIEYDIYPMPDTIVEIFGPLDICEGTSSVAYSVKRVANAVSYVWTVPPGVIIQSYHQNWHSNWIIVDYPAGAQNGQIGVKAVNNCGEGIGLTANISIHQNPFVDAGSDQNLVLGDTAWLSATASQGTPPYTYDWRPGSIFNDQTLQNPEAYPYTNTVVTIYLTDTFGCQASDQLNLFVGPPGGRISGVISYDNASSSPLSNNTVYLVKNLDTVAMDTTDNAGYYEFIGLDAGIYELSVSSIRAWGGVNATDALLVAQHFVDISYLQGLRHDAGDVNGSAYLNTVDALLCQQRFIGIVNSYVVGDWLFQSSSASVSGNGAATRNLKGICYGDVDGSNPLNSKAASNLSLDVKGEMSTPASGRLSLPFTIEEHAEFAALSLILKIPAGYKVDDVRMANEDAGDNLLFNVSGQELRIAWFNTEVLIHKAGDVVFYIDVSYSVMPHSDWAVNDGSIIADANGTPLQSISFTYPEISLTEAGFILGSNYPNPFNTVTTIPFTLPAEGKVRLSVLNLLGEEIMVIIDGKYDAGMHEVTFDGSRLASGIYHYRMIAEAANQRYERTSKLIISR